MGVNQTQVLKYLFMTHGTTTKINRSGGDLIRKFVFAFVFFYQPCCFEAQCDFRKPHVTEAELEKEWQQRTSI